MLWKQNRCEDVNLYDRGGSNHHPHTFFYFSSNLFKLPILSDKGGVILSLKNKLNQFLLLLMEKEVPKEEIDTIIEAGDIIDKYGG